MKGEMDGKVALVTGSGRAIGKAIAVKLAEMGCKVAVNDLPDSLEASQTITQIQESGGEASLAAADVREAKMVKTMVSAISEKWGRIDILVNNAGIFRDKMILRMSEEDWDTVMAINLKGAFLCSKSVLTSMMARNWGRIINISSVAGTLGNMGRVNYSASKGGLAAFTRSLAAEVGSRNITVNAIAPGFIVTTMTSDLPLEYRDNILARTAIKRAGTVEDVAGLAAFLASERASYITGQVVGVDGGLV